MSGPVTASGEAWGKVILAGEHAVVYGSPALAAALDRGARATARRRGEPGLSLLRLGTAIHEPTSEDPAGAESDPPDPGRAFGALLAAVGGSIATAAVEVEAASDLPAGGGLGSSAALGVAVGRALARLGALPDEPEADVEARALAGADAWERVLHGRPSGIDTAVAARGGCIRFARDEGGTPLHLGADLWLCVGSTGSRSSTRSMVESVARMRERRASIVDRSVEGIRSIVENTVHALRAGDLDAVGKLMDLNQMILAGLFVSTETIERMCGLARRAGALGAKLTGAGGGGAVIALAASARASAEHVSDEAAGAAAEAILEAWRAEGHDGFLARLGQARPGGEG